MGTLLLRRLKKAIERVKFLLSTNLSQWLYVGSAASAARRLSFRDHPGLLDIVSDDDDDAAASSRGPSMAASPAPGRILSRTVSSTWAEVSRSPSVARTAGSASSSSSAAAAAADPDVDNRADAFIANFWRHIQIERQVSLELRYCKSNSLDSAASD